MSAFAVVSCVCHHGKSRQEALHSTIWTTNSLLLYAKKLICSQYDLNATVQDLQRHFSSTWRHDGLPTDSRFHLACFAFCCVDASQGSLVFVGKGQCFLLDTGSTYSPRPLLSFSTRRPCRAEISFPMSINPLASGTVRPTFLPPLESGFFCDLASPNLLQRVDHLSLDFCYYESAVTDCYNLAPPIVLGAPEISMYHRWQVFPKNFPLRLKPTSSPALYLVTTGYFEA